MRTFKIVLILDARKHILKEIEQCAQGHLLNVIYLYITLLFKNGSLKQRTFIISSLAGEMGGTGIWEQLQLICMDLALVFPEAAIKVSTSVRSF